MKLSRSDYPERVLKHINHSKTALLPMPMHVGCAFAVDRDFFYELGSYDNGMEIWGSENLELALRVGHFVIICMEINSTDLSKYVGFHRLGCVEDHYN